MAASACVKCFPLLLRKVVLTSVLGNPLLPAVSPVVLSTRNIKKHYDPKWRKQRAQKVQRLDLPDWQEIKRDSTLPPDKMRAKVKKENRLPPRENEERSLHISTTNGIFEPYVPPEGDGLASPISGKRLAQTGDLITKKGKSFTALRTISKMLGDDFDQKEFPSQAQDIYIEANKLLQDIDANKQRLHQLVTEYAYPKMTWKLAKKTFVWKFIESIEPPRIVHARQTEIITKENTYGQITVRLHTKQTLALYDRFGRLMFGNEDLVRDCLEYVVFENHISDTNGVWRVHDKLTPEWSTKAPPIIRTMRQPNMEDDVVDEEQKQVATT